MKYLAAMLVVLVSANTWALKVGDSVPQIIGRTTSGEMFALSQHTKKPKVLNFFWVQCVPCKKEIPLLAEKETVYANVEFIVIHAENNPATDTNYNIEDIATFIKTLPAAPKNVVLGSAKLKEDLGIKGFPMSILVSADNKVEKILSGFNDSTIPELHTWLEYQQ